MVANAFSISSSLRPCRTRIACPTAWAAVSIWRSCSGVDCVCGPTRKAIKPGCGRISRSNSRRFGITSVPKMYPPVALPAGRLKLATRPSCTGSPPAVNTIGMVAVAFFAAPAAGDPVATSDAAGSPISSAARDGRRSKLPSAYRYSIATFRPTTKPCCSNPSRTPVRSGVSASAERLLRYPMTGRPGCAVAPNGASAAAPPISARSSRRFMYGWPPPCKRLLDDLVGPREDQRRDGEAERVHGLQVDDQADPPRLLDRQIGGFGALQNPADIIADPAEKREKAVAI